RGGAPAAAVARWPAGRRGLQNVPRSQRRRADVQISTPHMHMWPSVRFCRSGGTLCIWVLILRPSPKTEPWNQASKAATLQPDELVGHAGALGPVHSPIGGVEHVGRAMQGSG